MAPLRAQTSTDKNSGGAEGGNESPSLHCFYIPLCLYKKSSQSLHIMQSCTVLDILFPYISAGLGWTKACLATAVHNCRALLAKYPWSSACQKCQLLTRNYSICRNSGSSKSSLKHQATFVYKLLGFHNEVSISLFSILCPQTSSAGLTETSHIPAFPVCANETEK